MSDSVSLVTGAGREAAGTARRVAVFAGAYDHIADGVALTVNHLVEYLDRRGIPVRVFAPTVDDPALDHAGNLVPVPSLPIPGRSDYRFSLGLTPSVRAELEEFGPTLYQISTPDFLGLQALHRARRKGLPVAGTYHTHFASYLKYYHLSAMEPVVWRYLRHFYSRCDHVYVATETMEAELRRRGVERGVRLWRRGVDLERFDPSRSSPSWRRSHGIGEDEVVVAFVSRLVPEKGIDTYAEVIQRLQDRGVPHRSLVVGDGPAREALERRLPDTTFTGFLDGLELARAYASSDVFLFPSETETFGKVTLEAMASGLPAVCADAPGSRDLVDGGASGFLCSPGEVDEFAERVRRLATDPSLRRTMGECARRRACGFAREEVLARVVEHYGDLLGPEAEAEAPARPAGRSTRAARPLERPARVGGADGNL